MLKISRLLRLLSTGLKVLAAFMDAGSTVKMAEFCLSLVKDSTIHPSSLPLKTGSVCLGSSRDYLIQLVTPDMKIANL